MTEKIRVMHVLHFGRMNKRNGVIDAVLSLAQAQRRAGGEVLVASASQNTSVAENEYSLFRTKADFEALLLSFKPDIVHVHDMYWMEMPMVAHCLKNNDIPYLLTFHGGASKVSARKKWFKKKVARILLFNYVIRNAKRVVYLTEGEMRSSIAHRTNSRYLIIPNGISLPEKLPERLPEKPFTIIFLSRMEFHGKGIDLLEQAVSKLKNELSGQVQFKLYGYTYDDTYHIFDQYGDFARYCGYVQGEEKAKVLAEADIMILPSRSEGMPVSILEGLAYGLPCIVTPQTNMGDLVQNGRCGWVCQLSAESIADTIRQAVADYQSNSSVLQSNARAAAERYSWQNIANQSLEQYRNIITNENAKS
ncbi:MAG: glycosyltransferase [Bacteroidales bacterium]|nr:glycosyltransferase [Bacteroidales bacterium]MBR5029376.1 glycosyltransferase [Bacteroidales bacterium]